MKQYGSVAEVVHALGSQARHDRKCDSCRRPGSTVYPLLALLVCADCMVTATSGVKSS